MYCYIIEELETTESRPRDERSQGPALSRHRGSYNSPPRTRKLRKPRFTGGLEPVGSARPDTSSCKQEGHGAICGTNSHGAPAFRDTEDHDDSPNKKTPKTTLLRPLEPVGSARAGHFEIGQSREKVEPRAGTRHQGNTTPREQENLVNHASEAS